MSNKFFILSGLVLILITSVAGGAFADDVDTAAGTLITAEGYENYIDYNDIAGNPKATVYGPTLEAGVMSIYGLASAGPGTPTDQTVDPSAAASYTYFIENNGNTTDAYSLTYDESYTGDSGSAWSFKFIQDDNQDGDRQIGEVTEITSLTLAEDADSYFFLEVIPAADAGSGSIATVIISIETTATPTGEYTGANGNTYGGPGLLNDVTNTNVQAPIITLTRTMTVDAPSGYNQTDDDHYPIPGAMVTITMSYSNEGSASAEANIIIDKVPTGHQAGHLNADTTDINNIVITVPDGTATGWTGYYTTEATISSAQRGYNDLTGWVTLGGISGGVIYSKDTGTPLPLTAEYIKWEKTTVEAGEYGTLTWGYIIR